MDGILHPTVRSISKLPRACLPTPYNDRKFSQRRRRLFRMQRSLAIRLHNTEILLSDNRAVQLEFRRKRQLIVAGSFPLVHVKRKQNHIRMIRECSICLHNGKAKV